MAITDLQGQTAIHARIYDRTAITEKRHEVFWDQFTDFNIPGGPTGDEAFANAQKLGGINSYEGMPVIKHLRFKQEAGDRISYYILDAITGNGILDSSQVAMAGNEVAMSSYADTLIVDGLSNAVAFQYGELGEQQFAYDIKAKSKSQLASWLVNRQDEMIFDVLLASPTNQLFPGSATSTGTLTASDTLDMSILMEAMASSNMSNGGAKYRIEPFRFKGRKYLFAVTNPSALFDLKQDSTFRQAQENALNRGNYFDHPIFAGATAITVDGIVLYENEHVPTVSTYGSGGNIDGTSVLVFGNGALHIGEAIAPYFATQIDDYGRKTGTMISQLWGCKKPTFNSKDFGSLQIQCAVGKILT